MAVGPGARDKDGGLIPMALTVGDTVLLPEYGGQVVKVSLHPHLSPPLPRQKRKKGKECCSHAVVARWCCVLPRLLALVPCTRRQRLHHRIEQIPKLEGTFGSKRYSPESCGPTARTWSVAKTMHAEDNWTS